MAIVANVGITRWPMCHTKSIKRYIMNKVIEFVGFACIVIGGVVGLAIFFDVLVQGV